MKSEKWITKFINTGHFTGCIWTLCYKFNPRLLFDEHQVNRTVLLKPVCILPVYIVGVKPETVMLIDRLIIVIIISSSSSSSSSLMVVLRLRSLGKSCDWVCSQLALTTSSPVWTIARKCVFQVFLLSAFLNWIISQYLKVESEDWSQMWSNNARKAATRWLILLVTIFSFSWGLPESLSETVCLRHHRLMGLQRYLCR